MIRFCQDGCEAVTSAAAGCGSGGSCTCKCAMLLLCIRRETTMNGLLQQLPGMLAGCFVACCVELHSHGS
jgi:hypothetical protein